MFETLIARLVRRARERAEAQASMIAARLTDQAPPDVKVERDAEGVCLSGRRLGHRFTRGCVLCGLIEGGWE